MPLHPYRGSCHCAAVSFTALLDLTTTRTSKCNCSICAKTRAWEVTLPARNFTLHLPAKNNNKPSSSSGVGDADADGGDADTPAVEEKDLVTDYTFPPNRAHHLFCKVCGVRAFGRVDSWPGFEDVEGGWVSVSISCLDGVSDEELEELSKRVIYRNGREGKFKEGPERTGFL